MTKIKLTILSIIVLLSSSIWSQDAKPLPTINFENESEIIGDATGWAYNKNTSEWVTYPNRINNDKKYAETPQDEGYLIRNSYQSFIDMQTKSVVINKRKYYVLILNTWHERANRSIFKRDTESFKAKKLYIFTEDQFAMLYDWKKGTDIAAYSFQTIELLPYMDRSDEGILKRLNKELINERLSYTPTAIFHVKKTSDNEVRFLLPVDLNGAKDESDFTNNYFVATVGNFAKIVIK